MAVDAPFITAWCAAVLLRIYLLGLMKRNDVLLTLDYKFLKSGPGPEFFDN